jgi:F-type H+-transporting ATPase subunit c
MDLTFFGAGMGAAFAVFGAGYGIGRLSSSALDGIARQPEAAGDLRGTMIIAAALIEGIAFMALVICLLLVLLK